jgi:putative ABC transport system permease protein
VEKIPGKDMVKISPMVTALHRQLIERVVALPGVESVGMISIIPPFGVGLRYFSILGHPAPSGENSPEAFINEVSPSYFRTMKIPLKKGRYFDEQDTEKTPWVVVISETFASRYFPNEDPIGQELLLSDAPQLVDEDRPRQIIGVVGEVKQMGMGGLHPLLYESFLQQREVFRGNSGFLHLSKSLVIRTTSDVRAHEVDITASVKQIVKEMDPDLPVTDVTTMDDAIAKFMRPSEVSVIILGVFAGIALVLAAIGVYGVLSYLVNRRTREIGIRLALGAQRRDVLQMVAGLGLKLSMAGVAIGIVLALGLNQFMAWNSWVYDPESTHPATYAAVALLLVSVALLACYVPARRATKVDPITILRHD